MRTTRKQYFIYQETARRLQEELGLMQYGIAFDLKDLGHNNSGSIIFAEITVDELGKGALLTLSDHYRKKDTADFDVEKLARHEMFHLLVHRLYWLGFQRYLNPTDLDEEYEAVATRLENFTS